MLLLLAPPISISLLILVVCVLFSQFGELSHTAVLINHSDESCILYRCLEELISLCEQLATESNIAYVNRYIACKHVSHNEELAHLRLPDQSAMALSQGTESWMVRIKYQGGQATHLSHRRRFAQTNAIKAQMYRATIELRVR